MTQGPERSVIIKVRGEDNVAIIANAGYEKTYAADNLGDLQLARFDEKTMAALKAVMPPMVEPDPLLDLTPMADEEIYEQLLERG